MSVLYSFVQLFHVDIGILLIAIFEGLPLVVDSVLGKRLKSAVSGLDFVLEESAQLSSIEGEAELSEAAQDACDAHVVVE